MFLSNHWYLTEDCSCWPAAFTMQYVEQEEKPRDNIEYLIGVYYLWINKY